MLEAFQSITAFRALAVGSCVLLFATTAVADDSGESPPKGTRNSRSLDDSWTLRIAGETRKVSLGNSWEIATRPATGEEPVFHDVDGVGIYERQISVKSGQSTGTTLLEVDGAATAAEVRWRALPGN